MIYADLTKHAMAPALDAHKDLNGEAVPGSTHLLMEIRVKCEQAVSVKGKTKSIAMIPFTGETEGKYFTGKVIGAGVDTQKIDPQGKAVLSARYMLEGTDYGGNPCRIFIENQGSWQEGFTPRIVTDSSLLKELETAELTATVDGIPGGVLVRIFRKE